MRKINKKGFTLIEIIVVVVILAVLMAVAVPAVMSYLDEADDAKLNAQMRGFYTKTQTLTVKELATREYENWQQLGITVTDKLREDFPYVVFIASNDSSPQYPNGDDWEIYMVYTYYKDIKTNEEKPIYAIDKIDYSQNYSISKLQIIFTKKNGYRMYEFIPHKGIKRLDY